MGHNTYTCFQRTIITVGVPGTPTVDIAHGLIACHINADHCVHALRNKVVIATFQVYLQALFGIVGSINVVGSWKMKMPTRTVPTAPIPVHIG